MTPETIAAFANLGGLLGFAALTYYQGQQIIARMDRQSEAFNGHLATLRSDIIELLSSAIRGRDHADHEARVK